MACPFFFPGEKSINIAWAFPSRLPLGAGFCGTCRAAGSETVPGNQELRDFCNIGYAGHCSRIPVDRHADCVRFVVTSDEGERITLHYIYEREHAPVTHGKLSYDCAAQSWNAALEDVCVQRQAECYLSTYLERRPRARIARP